MNSVPKKNNDLFLSGAMCQEHNEVPQCLRTYVVGLNEDMRKPPDIPLGMLFLRQTSLFISARSLKCSGDNLTKFVDCKSFCSPSELQFLRVTEF